MRIVVALGGNALTSPQRGPDDTREHVRDAVRGIAEVAAEHDVVVTHGNGPQVGVLSSESSTTSLPHGLDVLGAETEGLLGYLLQLELMNQLRDRDIATLLTLVEVDPADHAFISPSKPIGMVLGDDARADAAARGWRFVAATGGWRRVVPSPAPTRLVAPEPLQTLVGSGTVVICGGGGGIPVVHTPRGLVGVEAVIDKDATSALVAEAIGADVLVLATGTDAVYEGWGTDHAAALHHESPTSLARRSFAAGSMQPKVAAACAFVARTSGRAVIGALDAIPDLVAGTAGTVITGRIARHTVDQPVTFDPVGARPNS
jgi:carbamate kinase